MKNKLNKNLKVLFIDFDGVLTNNKVTVDENGIESVLCNRADSLYADLLKKNFFLEIIIISSEKNKVVKIRSEKMNLNCIHGITSKYDYINQYILDAKLDFNNLVYIGNDLNDFEAMEKCYLKICPFDSAKEIIDISDIVLQTKGGDGILREVYNIFKKNYEISK